LEEHFREFEHLVGLAQGLALTAQEPSKPKHKRVSAY
jgi:hypothetical protein